MVMTSAQDAAVALLTLPLLVPLARLLMVVLALVISSLLVFRLAALVNSLLEV